MKVVGRIYLANQAMSGDATAAAQAWWSLVQSTVLGTNDVDYWEGYNEPDVSTLAAMQWYA